MTIRQKNWRLLDPFCWCLRRAGACAPFRAGVANPSRGVFRQRHGAGFQPLLGFSIGTWGVAPGWFEGAPLALRSVQSQPTW